MCRRGEDAGRRASACRSAWLRGVLSAIVLALLLAASGCVRYDDYPSGTTFKFTNGYSLTVPPSCTATKAWHPVVETLSGGVESVSLVAPFQGSTPGLTAFVEAISSSRAQKYLSGYREYYASHAGGRFARVRLDGVDADILLTHNDFHGAIMVWVWDSHGPLYMSISGGAEFDAALARNEPDEELVRIAFGEVGLHR